MRRASADTSVVIHITGRAYLWVCVGLALMRLAAWILGARVRIEDHREGHVDA